MRRLQCILWALAMLLLSGSVAHATTNAARVKNWTAEKLYATDLNTEFDNLITYLNNNVAWVTNVTATATEINQLHLNRFTNAYRFVSAVEDSANETMYPGFVYTNNGRAVFDSARVDTLNSPTTGTQLGASFFMVPLTDLTTYIGTPTKRIRSISADTGRVQVAALDSLTGNTISDSWTLTPKTNSTGRIGSNGKRLASTSVDTLLHTVLFDSNDAKTPGWSYSNLASPPPYTGFAYGRKPRPFILYVAISNPGGVNKIGITDGSGTNPGDVYSGGWFTTSAINLVRATTSVGTASSNVFWDTSVGDTRLKIRKINGAMTDSTKLNAAFFGSWSSIDASVDVSSITGMLVSETVTDANFTGASSSSLSLSFFNVSASLVDPWSVVTNGNIWELIVQGISVE